MVRVRGIYYIFEYITFSKYLFGRHGHSLIGSMLKIGAAAWGKQAADVIHNVIHKASQWGLIHGLLATATTAAAK